MLILGILLFVQTHLLPLHQWATLTTPRPEQNAASFVMRLAPGRLAARAHVLLLAHEATIEGSSGT